MKIMKHGIEVMIREDMVRAEEDYGILHVDQLAATLREIYGRQVERLYIVEDDNCGPALLVQWIWNLDEDGEYEVFAVTCSVEEEALLRRIGVL